MRTSRSPSIWMARAAAVALACLTAAAVIAPSVFGAPPSKEALACGGTRNKVLAEFDISRPSDIFRVFPAMLKSPELMDDPAPAHVVVFAGDFDLNGMISGPGNVPLVQDAVCVVQADGTVNLYDGVSRAGMNLPAP
jgi:hypothetical protein